MLDANSESLLSPHDFCQHSISQLDQHRLEELIRLCPPKREPPAPVAADVPTESLVRRELDLAHVASGLLHTDEVVNVDIRAFDILESRSSQLIRGEMACRWG